VDRRGAGDYPGQAGAGEYVLLAGSGGIRRGSRAWGAGGVAAARVSLPPEPFQLADVGIKDELPRNRGRNLRTS
jgi:hypothetical protein